MAQQQQRIANRYSLQSQLGKGSMGAVYRAHDRLTGESVALKRLLKSPGTLAFNSRNTISSQNPHLELAHEFQTLASLRHPHVVSVQDYGFDADGAYFTMQILEDAQPFTAAPDTTEDAITLTLQLLQGLAYIHQRGLLHRDLKPTNVLVKNKHIHIVDFGLAIAERPNSDKQEIAGTLAYIAPETFAHGHVSPGSDLYAVGVMLYELLAGHHPYWDDNPLVLMNNILQEPVDVSTLDTTPEIMLLLHRLLSKDPEDRYSRAEDVITALCAAAGRPIPPETSEIRESFLQAAAFVGRRPEYDQLLEGLQATKRGQGSAWLIGGESGVGKSRLIQEVATLALVGGALVLRCQAKSEAESGYGMWRDALRRLALFVEISDDEAVILKPILPALDTLLERHIPDAEATDLDQRLPMLFDALFHRATALQPIILIIEDLQWVADAPHEIRLMNTLVNLSAALPLMVLGSYRNDERPDLPQALSAAQTLQLGRLTPEEIARLSTSMLGDAGSRPQVVNFLNQHTEGNVFFLIEVVRVLAEDAGRITDIGLNTLPTHIIADGVQRVVDYRLARVPDWARALVDMAAVVGRSVEIALMQALAPQADINAWLDVCMNAAVFDTQDGQYRFSHDKLREGVLTALSTEQRQSHHRRIADALQTVYADNLDEAAAAIANHYHAADEPAQEALFVLRAAHRAYSFSNYQEGAYFYGRAHTLQVHLNAEDPAHQAAEILLGMGKCAYALSDYETCRQWSQQAATLFQELGDEVGYADAINNIGESYFRQGLNDDAQPLLMTALDIRQRHNLAEQVGYTLMNLGVVAAQTGNLEQAKAYFEDCYAAMQKVDAPIAIARAMNNLAIIYDMMDDYANSEDFHRRALKIRREINDRVGIGYSLLNLSQLFNRIDVNPSDIEPMMLEARSLLRISGQRDALSAVLSSLGIIYMNRGNYARADEFLREGLQIRIAIGNRVGTSATYNALSELALKHGNIKEARENIRHALNAVANLSAGERHTEDLYTLATVLTAQNKLVEALAVYETVQSHLVADDALPQQVSASYDALKARVTSAQLAQAQAMYAGWTIPQLVQHYAQAE